ncbi:ATP-dependent helicase [Sesbania bispinosa]|nr:ATP-dependent helicase [Sesbania bispinosa]
MGVGCVFNGSGMDMPAAARFRGEGRGSVVSSSGRNKDVMPHIHTDAMVVSNIVMDKVDIFL